MTNYQYPLQNLDYVKIHNSKNYSKIDKYGLIDLTY